MAKITRQYTFANGTQSNADYVNYEFDTIVQLINGMLDDENILEVSGNKIKLGTIGKDRFDFAIGVLNDLAPSLTGSYSSEKVEEIVTGIQNLIAQERTLTDENLSAEVFTLVDNINMKANADNVYTIPQVDTLMLQFDEEKADKVDTYTKLETDNLLDDKANGLTTYSKDEVNGLVENKVNMGDVYLTSETLTMLEIDELINLKQDEIIFSDMEPIGAVLNALWVNTVTNELRRYNGTQFVLLGGSSGGGGGAGIDDLSTGSTTTYSSSKIEGLVDMKADLDHSHTEYASTGALTTLQTQVDGLDSSNFEKIITVVPDISTLVVADYELGEKVLHDGQLKIATEESLATVSHPTFPVTSLADLTAQGWTLTQASMYNWSTLNYRIFDGDVSTSIRASAINGWFAVEFPAAKLMQEILVLNTVPALIVEASVDGVNYETAVNMSSMGSTKAEEIYRLSAPKLIKKVRFTFPTYVTTEAVFEIKFQVIGGTLKSMKPYKIGVGAADIKLFGALESSEDNSVFIQKAVDTYRSVIVPRGVWKIKSPIYLPSNTYLELQEGAEIVRNDNLMKGMFFNQSLGTVGGYDANNNIHIFGKGTINGNHTAFADKDFGGIVLAHSKQSSIKGITLKNWTAWHQIEINSSRDVKIHDVNFTAYVSSANASEALQIDGSFGSAQLPFKVGEPYDSTMCANIEIKNCTFDGVHHGIGSHSSALNKLHRKIKIDNCVFKNLTGYAVTGLNWEDVDIVNNLVEDAKYGFYLYLDGVGTNSGRIRVKNNRLYAIGVVGGVYDNVARGIQISSSAVKTNGRFSKVFIEDNFLSQIGRHGIGFDYSESVFVRGNSVQNVWVVGIWSYGATGVIIDNNSVDTCNLSATAQMQAIKIGSSGGASATADTGIILVGNRATTIGIDQTDKVSFINNIYSTGGTYLPATNTNLVNTGNIQV